MKNASEKGNSPVWQVSIGPFLFCLPIARLSPSYCLQRKDSVRVGYVKNFTKSEQSGGYSRTRVAICCG